MSRVGIYSGTFDPVHTGHVAFALEAVRRANLDKVVFLPEETPREKTPTSFQDRLNMLRLVVTPHDNLYVDVLKTTQFNIANTLPEIKEKHSGQLVMLLGSDVIKTFTYRWPGLQQLLQSVELVIGLRGSDTDTEVEAMLEHCETNYKLKIAYKLIPSPRSFLASTHIRQGRHYIDDIDPKIAQYIKANNLYKDSSDLKA